MNKKIFLYLIFCIFIVSLNASDIIEYAQKTIYLENMSAQKNSRYKKNDLDNSNYFHSQKYIREVSKRENIHYKPKKIDNSNYFRSQYNIRKLSTKKNIFYIPKKEEKSFFHIKSNYIGFDIKTANLSEVMGTNNTSDANSDSIQDITIKYGVFKTYWRNEIELHIIQEKYYSGTMIGLNRDWIFYDFSKIFKPFIGINGGIGSFAYNYSQEDSIESKSVSFLGTYGGARIGVLTFLSSNFSIEFGFSYQLFYGKNKIEQSIDSEDSNNLNNLATNENSSSLSMYSTPYFSLAYHFGGKISYSYFQE